VTHQHQLLLLQLLPPLLLLLLLPLLRRALLSLLRCALDSPTLLLLLLTRPVLLWHAIQAARVLLPPLQPLCPLVLLLLLPLEVMCLLLLPAVLSRQVEGAGQ
jgi:hypothetical protein